jgi:hypothetical protein
MALDALVACWPRSHHTSALAFDHHRFDDDHQHHDDHPDDHHHDDDHHDDDHHDHDRSDGPLTVRGRETSRPVLNRIATLLGRTATRSDRDADLRR